MLSDKGKILVVIPPKLLDTTTSEELRQTVAFSIHRHLVTMEKSAIFINVAVFSISFAIFIKPLIFDEVSDNESILGFFTGILGLFWVVKDLSVRSLTDRRFAKTLVQEGFSIREITAVYNTISKYNETKTYKKTLGYKSITQKVRRITKQNK